MTNDELLHKWVEGTITEDEMKFFQARPEYPSLVELYKNTEGFSAPKFAEEEILSDILSQPKNSLKVVKGGRRTFLNRAMKYAAAAAVVLLVGWFLWQYDDGLTRHQMAAGESMEALLPDESIFYLNAGSSISYDEKNWAEDRTLNLEGEAFFEVKKGSTFTVKTPNGSVQVLGTEFNVWSRKKTLEVQCQSGRVAILNKKGEKLDELRANDIFRITDGELIKKWEMSNNSAATWREGISKFSDVPLWVVLEELERQYDIKVKTRNTNKEEILSCNFQHENLELALRTILSPLEINYKIIDNKTVELYQ